MKNGVQGSHRGEGRRIRVLAGYMEWKLMPAETGGRYCVLETFIPPGAHVPPHQHVDHEAFYVLEGAVANRGAARYIVFDISKKIVLSGLAASANG